MESTAVTGGAGFIGSNLAESLVVDGHRVLVIDNFSTGSNKNLDGWAERAGDRLKILNMDVNETDALREAFGGISYVFHLAAIPSVPRSIADPQATQRANIDGTLSVLIAARDAKVKRVVAASSSSIYGDDSGLPKIENRIGRPLSPYALSKSVTEEYCRLFHKLFGLETVCLRYFNVFGPRQDPKSEYAAVVPRFATRMLAGKQPTVYGDGEQSRDFTFVTNVVDANWKAATAPDVGGEAFNIGCGNQVSLNHLLVLLNQILGTGIPAIHEPGRPGDVRHSVADISKAKRLINYSPTITIKEGLEHVLNWYRKHLMTVANA